MGRKKGRGIGLRAAVARVAAVAAGFGGVTGVGCSLVVPSSPTGGGIGAQCTRPSDCRGSSCLEGVCTAACSAPTDCPEGAVCTEGLCAKILRVAALYDGVLAEQEAWTFGHHTGIAKAAAALPYVQFTQWWEGLSTEQAEQKLDQAIGAGADVVVGTTLSFADLFVRKAERYPDHAFILAMGESARVRPNFGTYVPSGEGAFFLAGALAGQRVKARACVLASLPHPGVVTQLNAFVLGLRKVNPSAVAEVRWLGHWLDAASGRSYASRSGNGEALFLEEWLTDYFEASGCEVMVHLDNTSRSLQRLDATAKTRGKVGMLAISGDRKECLGDPPRPTCLGATFSDVAPYFRRTFAALHRHDWLGRAERLTVEATDSPSVGVATNPLIPIDSTSFRQVTTAFAGDDGLNKMFAGPFETTGQLDRDRNGVPDADQVFPAGQWVTREEFESTCWFVKGVVEKSVYDDPKSPDRDARVPDGTMAIPTAHYAPSPSFANDAPQRYNCLAFVPKRTP